MKVLSLISALVVTTLVGVAVAAPVASPEAAPAPQPELQDRGLATMFYGCDMEYEVDDADPDAVEKLRARVSSLIQGPYRNVDAKTEIVHPIQEINLTLNAWRLEKRRWCNLGSSQELCDSHLLRLYCKRIAHRLPHDCVTILSSPLMISLTLQETSLVEFRYRQAQNKHIFRNSLTQLISLSRSSLCKHFSCVT